MNQKTKYQTIQQDSRKRNGLKFISGHRTDLIVVGFMLLCLCPVLSSWYYGDDTTTRDIYALMRQENRNFFQYIFRQMDYYIIQVGRFFPIHILQRFSTFYIFNTIEKYRIFIIIMNILAIFSFAIMTRYYSGSKKLYYAILILFPGVFLFLSQYDDAITSYFMFIQTLVIYLSFSLICLKHSVEKEKAGSLILSLFFYLLSLLTYESSYPLVLVYPFAIFYLCKGTLKERLRISFRRSIPYLVTTLVCFIVYASFSVNAAVNYQGVNYNFEPEKLLSTLAKQTFAALPLAPHLWLLKNPDWKYIFSSITILDLTTTVLFICLLSCAFTIYKKDRISAAGKRFLIWLAVLLIICPSLLISISTKYQQSLTWGNGYLTAYISRFGFLLLGFILYDCIETRLKSKTITMLLNVTLCIWLAAISLFSQQGNRKVLEYKNQTAYLRLIAEESFKSGLMDGISEDAVILLGNIWYDYPSFTRDKLFSDVLAQKVTTMTLKEFYSALQEDPEKRSAQPSLAYKNLAFEQLLDSAYSSCQVYSQNANRSEAMSISFNESNVYYLHFEKFLSNKGFSFICKLDTLLVDSKDITGLYGRDFKIFYNGDESDSVRIAVKQEDTFIGQTYSLYEIGYKSYMAAVPGTVDLDTVELVNKLKSNIWE